MQRMEKVSRDRISNVIRFLTIGIVFELAGGMFMLFSHNDAGLAIVCMGFLLIVASVYSLWFGNK